MAKQYIHDHDSYKEYHLELTCFACGTALRTRLNSKQQLYSPKAVERLMEFHEWQHLQNKEICPVCVQKAIDFLTPKTVIGDNNGISV